MSLTKDDLKEIKSVVSELIVASEERMKEFVGEAVDASEERMTARIDASEGRVMETINDLAETMGERFDAVYERFDAIDKRFKAADKKLDAVSADLRKEIRGAKDDVYEEIRVRDSVQVKQHAAVIDDIEGLDIRVTKLEQARA